MLVAFGIYSVYIKRDTRFTIMDASRWSLDASLICSKHQGLYVALFVLNTVDGNACI
jgi:hypothetical protein